MTGGHSHSHAPVTATGRHRRRLVLVVAITAAVFVAQVIGGLASGSLALLADAGHMATDAGVQASIDGGWSFETLDG